MIETLKQIDQNILLWINSHHSAIFDHIMFYASKLWTSIPLFIIWLWFIYKKYNFKKGSAILVGLALLITLTDQTTNQVKHAVKRYRPTHNAEIKERIHIVNDYHGGKYGFFSAHAANTFSVAMFLCLLFSNGSLIFRSSFFLWALFVTYSRMYLGVHYPSDVFVGMIDGLLFGYLLFKLTNWFFIRFFKENLEI